MINISQAKNVVLLLSLCMVSTVSLAQNRGEGGKRGAPPEAIEACSSLAEGSACEFEGRRGNVSGTCVVPSQTESALACKPANHGSRGDKGAQE